MKPISLQQSSNTNCHPRSTNSRSVRSQLKGWSRLMKTGWTCFSPCSYKGWWWSFWHFWPHHLSRPNLGYQYLRISRRRPQVCVCVCASHVPTKSTILLISANNFDSCSSCQTLNILQPPSSAHLPKSLRSPNQLVTLALGPDWSLWSLPTGYTLSDFVGIFPAWLLSSFSTHIGLVILDVRHSSEPKYAKVLKEEHISILIYTDPCGTFFFAGSVTFVGKICWRNFRELHVWWVSNKTLTNDTRVTPHSDSMFLLPVLVLAHSQPPVLIPKPPSYLETSLPLRLPTP